MIGKTLGHYKVGEQLGRGGMGEVYVADDLSLNRKVALKFLPDAFTGDPERMARFEREARLLASLNHPNIAAIYGLEHAEGKRFIVMELVEGESLAQRLSKGPLPVEEALGICRQIAEGLEAAHEKGVIHRDLKPANVMITPGDKIKILDFGLAKALADESQIDASKSPTITEAMTQPGAILGTAACMSPEQAKGKAADKRADIWAFGCILYECLAGKRAFEGETVAETLAAILKGEPDWKALPAMTPPNIRFVLRRCLEKDMNRRLHHADDLRILIEEAGSSLLPLEARAPARSAWKAVALVFVGLFLAAAIGGIALWTLRSTVPAKVARFPLVLPEDQSFTFTDHHLVAISPDGASIVYVADDKLYLRRLSEMEASPISGTQRIVASPFFSPDGQWIVFYSYLTGALKKIAISGGAAVTLCKTSNFYSLSWQGDTIIFSQGPDGILAVPSAGGTPQVWFRPEPGEVVSSPQILPGGNAILFAVLKSGPASGTASNVWDKADIVVYSRETGKRKILVQGGSSPRYLPTGHLIYALGTNLLMIPLDLERLEVKGGPVPIVEGVMRATYTGEADFAFSEDGTLVYIPSRSTPADIDQQVLALVDRNGKREMLGLPPGSYDYPRLSRDGKKLALGTGDEGGTVWVYDLSGGSALRRLTFEGLNAFPTWSPDGQQLAFRSYRENRPGIFLQAADGSGAAERLTGLPVAGDYRLTSWSADGKTIVFHANTSGADFGIWTVALTGKQKAELFVDLPDSFQSDGVFSPDGRWLAYVSDESGTFQVYVQPFPKTGAARYQISREGGVAPLWSPGGNELFYYQFNSQTLVAVPIQTRPAFSFGQPVPLPIPGITHGVSWRRYDITPDGKRFLVLLPAAQTGDQHRPTQQVNVVLNWFEELRRKQGK